MHVHIGDDTYGAVKFVGGFRVVTAFFHINSFPVWPRQSMVLGPSEGTGPETHAFFLNRIDWQSVTIAYVRGVAGGLAVLGCIPLFFGFIFWLLNDGQTDIPPSLIMSIGAVAIAIGVALGGASYLIWRTPESRERQIRLIANKQLAAAVDPALLIPGIARALADALESKLLEEGIYDYCGTIPRAHEFSEDVRQQLLLRVRCEESLSGNSPQLEGHANTLLRDLMTGSRVSAA